MNELLSDFLRLRCTEDPSAGTPLCKIVDEMRATCKRPVRRDEVLCGLSQAGFRFEIVDRRIYVTGVALRA
jgi:hypothetical protein